jgi:hypothetical protein
VADDPDAMVPAFRLAVARGDGPQLAASIAHLEHWADAVAVAVPGYIVTGLVVLVTPRRPVRLQAARDIATTCPRYVPASFKPLA